MYKKKLPNSEKLNRILTYYPDSGLLFWKHRDFDTFEYDGPHKLRIVNSWNKAHAGTQGFLTKLNTGYFASTIDGTPFLAHRIIWKMVHGVDPDHIDHINGVRHDNRLVNLRETNLRGNARNMGLTSKNTSGVMGVHWHVTNKTWTANIHSGKRLIHLGTFKSKEEAALARKRAEKAFGYHTNHGRQAITTYPRTYSGTTP